MTSLSKKGTPSSSYVMLRECRGLTSHGTAVQQWPKLQKKKVRCANPCGLGQVKDIPSFSPPPHFFVPWRETSSPGVFLLLHTTFCFLTQLAFEKSRHRCAVLLVICLRRIKSNDFRLKICIYRLFWKDLHLSSFYGKSCISRLFFGKMYICFFFFWYRVSNVLSHI